MDIAASEINLPKEIINSYNDRYSGSIKFVDKVLQSADNKHEFYVYDFNLFEIIKALKDEIRSMYLFKSGVPLSKWGSKGEHPKVEVNDEFIDLIIQSFNHAQDALFDIKITLLELPISRTGIDWENYYELYSLLMLQIPRLNTQDTMIVSACLVDDIEFLITKDSELKTSMGQINEVIGVNGLHFKTVDPGNASIWK